jgi:membrane-bound metal-dependent hydrolase YbcI (DUF457 family)
VDPVTHALSSYALKSAAFPRAARQVTIAILLAGTLADLDYLSAAFGPSAFLSYYRTGSHSLLVAAALALALTVAVFFLARHAANPRPSLAVTFIATFLAASLHLLLDLCQPAGIELLWPFSSRRFALDWLAHVDLWLLAIFLLAIVLPKISSLVTEEIGAKSRGPRGRLAASLAFAAAILYLVLRASLHGNAVATISARTYRGESPRRAAALPDKVSPFHWYGLIDTGHALHSVDVNLLPGASFDPESARTSYKPEPSPALDNARKTEVSARFLQATRFPKATIERTQTGFEVTLYPFLPPNDTSLAPKLQAVIDTDPSGQVVHAELAWSPRNLK